MGPCTAASVCHNKGAQRVEREVCSFKHGCMNDMQHLAKHCFKLDYSVFTLSWQFIINSSLEIAGMRSAELLACMALVT